jgi:zinc protease
MIMFRRTRAVLTLSFVLIVLTFTNAQAQSGPQITEVKSPGGISAWLVEDHAVPVIAMKFLIKGGGALDPAGKKGLANLVSGLLDEGAGSYDSLAFQTKLEDLAIGLSFGAGRDSFSGNLKTLTRHRDEAFELMRLALSDPRFDEEPVERIRRQIVTGLIRNQEDPDRIASRTWFAAAFPNHPYGQPHSGTIESVKAITTANLKSFVGERLNRESLIVGVVGDIKPEELRHLLDKTFLHLPAKANGFKVAAVDMQGAGKTEIIRKKNPQSRVIFGINGLKRSDPDWYAAYLLNYIVGGGSFSSRLYDEVREQRGLAYSVYTYLHGFDQTSMFMGGVGTVNARLPETLTVIHDVMRDVRDNGVKESELKDAKTYLNGSFPLNLTSSSRIAGLLIAMQRHELGIGYIPKRPGFINKVTLVDLDRVAKRLLQPENLLTVIVGDPPPLGVKK